MGVELLVGEIRKRLKHFMEEVTFVSDPENMISTNGNWEARIFQSQQRRQSTQVWKQNTDLYVKIGFSHYYGHLFIAMCYLFLQGEEGWGSNISGAKSDGKD